MKHNLTHGENLVRSEFEKGRPILDEDTMALWNAWFSASFENHFRDSKAVIENTFKELTEAHEQLVEDLNKDADDDLDGREPPARIWCQKTP